MDHLPLSQRLAHVLQVDEHLTFHELIERCGSRGFYLVLIFLALPMIIPVSVPGFSTIVGTIIGVLALRIAVGKSGHLPAFLGRRKISREVQTGLVGGGVKVLRLLERIVRRRKTGWLSWRVIHVANAGLIALMALLLALPIPLPFSNPLPGSAVILLAASMMEEDGVLIWFGYGMAAGSVSFFAFFSGLVLAFLKTAALFVANYLQALF